MTGLAIALVVGFGILAALAVFYYFGGYWRAVWRRKRLATASLHHPINLDTTEKR